MNGQEPNNAPLPSRVPRAPSPTAKRNHDRACHVKGEPFAYRSAPVLPMEFRRPFETSDHLRRRLQRSRAILEDFNGAADPSVDPNTREYLEGLACSCWSPFFRPLDSALEATTVMEGRPVVMLGANNYLGLTTHPSVTAAATEAIRHCGTGCTGSRLMNGTSRLHIELEERLARFLGKEEVLVFSAGFLANLGVLSGLATRDTYFISDKLNHASICEGLLAATARCVRFQHNDPEHLKRRLAKLPPAAPKWVVLEGVHSMLGDVSPLPELVAVAKDHGARIILDDAHGIGVLGEGGRGTADVFGLSDDIDVITGTFSKSFASYGGFVAGDRETIHRLRFGARAFIFTASLPPANVATVLRVLDILETEPGLVERLRANTLGLAARLRNGGVDCEEPPAAIIPLVVGPNDQTWKAWRLLYEVGVYTNAAFPPGVPPGQALLRISMMASMGEAALDYAAEAIAATFDVLGVRPCA